MRHSFPIACALAVLLVASASGTASAGSTDVKSTPKPPPAAALGTTSAATAAAIAAQSSAAMPIREHRLDKKIQAIQQTPPTVKPGSCGSAVDNKCVLNYRTTNGPTVMVAFDRTTGQLLPGELDKITGAMKKSELSEAARQAMRQRSVPPTSSASLTNAKVRDHRH